MRKAIATVSMSVRCVRARSHRGCALRRLRVVENDLLYSMARLPKLRHVDISARVRAVSTLSRLRRCSDALLRRNLDRASANSTYAGAGRKVDARLPNGLKRRPIRAHGCPALRALPSAPSAKLAIGYEALAWGRAVNLYSQAWSIVRRANHPHLGLILDSFHTLSLRDDPSASRRSPAKSLFMQLATRRCWQWTCAMGAALRCFPGQGQSDLEDFSSRSCCRLYRSDVAGIFNDLFGRRPHVAPPSTRCGRAFWRGGTEPARGADKTNRRESAPMKRTAH